MIEYLYNCIRATAGQDISIAAEITDDEGAAIVDGCGIYLHDPDKALVAQFDGVYDEENSQWIFTIPAATTEGLEGRYYYCIGHYNSSLCFKQPLYLM